LEQHLKQIIVNIKYEYEEGRLSGISLASMVVDKLPEPVLERHVQLFFLPLTLQLVNDDSKKCREAVASCLQRLLSRVSMDVVQSLYNFACRWSQGEGEVQRTALQLFGIFVDAREDFMKRGESTSQLLERLEAVLSGSNIENTEWEVFYFSLVSMEKLSKPFPKLINGRTKLWKVITHCLVHPHPFVKLVASRLLNKHLESLDATSFADDGSDTFLVDIPGSLYEIGRNLCYQLNMEEDQQSDELTTLSIKSLCWILPAMNRYPELCVADVHVGEVDKITDNPVGWVMQRLSSMAKPKGPRRRQAVFKAFAAFTTLCSEVAFRHMELMIEPLHRVDIETANDVERPSLTLQKNHAKKADGESISREATLAREVLQLLEEKCDPPDEFLRAYAVVKNRAREKKESRKILIRAQAIRDPQAAAKRRQEKNERERSAEKDGSRTVVKLVAEPRNVGNCVNPLVSSLLTS
jgi:U3 small nucleolar RNA-associated protein 20